MPWSSQSADRCSKTETQETPATVGSLGVVGWSISVGRKWQVELAHYEKSRKPLQHSCGKCQHGTWTQNTRKEFFDWCH